MVEHADLSEIATSGSICMGQDPTATRLALVTPDGAARAVADDLMFPNGMLITPDGKTLIVGETYGLRLTAFDIAEDLP